MNDKNVRLVFNSALKNIMSCNESFDQGVLRIAYHGENRNGSYISKEVFEKCLPSMYNVPVVANYMRDDDMIGGHDIEIVRKDRLPKMVNITHPVGVVPESATNWWELVTEEDGSVHEYLCTDVLLWKRQEAYEKIISDGIVYESMEIKVKEDHLDNGVYVIDDFEFLAFCLLGNCEPCFESASLATFSSDAFTTELYAMLEEVPMATRNYLEGVTNKLVNKKLKLVEKYGLTLDDLDFELAAYPESEVEDKLAAIRARLGTAQIDEEDPVVTPPEEEEPDTPTPPTPDNPTEESPTEPSTNPDTDPGTDVSQDSGQDDNQNDVEEHSLEEDQVDHAKDDSDDEEDKKPQDNDDEFACGEDEKKTSNTISEEDFALLKRELEELREFKNQILSEKKAELFSMFSDLESNEDFKNLKNDADKYDLTAIEEKCFAIRGRTATFSMNQTYKKAPVLPVLDHEPTYEPYGGVVKKYLHNK